METLEKDWPEFEGAEHVALGVLPSYMSGSSADATVWHKRVAAPADYIEDMESAHEDGKRYKIAYEKDVQFVLARTNHHVRLQTKKGRMPFSACRAKGKEEDTRVQPFIPKGKAQPSHRSLQRSWQKDGNPCPRAKKQPERNPRSTQLRMVMW